MVDDVVETWLACDHLRGVKGHLRTGLSNSLDGRDDWQISREAKLFWDLCEMKEYRTKLVAEVKEGVRSGKLSWASVRDMIVHPENPGVFDEGHEIEGELQPGELPWEEEASAREEANIEKMELESSASEDEGSPEASRYVLVQPGDDEALVADAESALREKAQLDVMRRAAVDLKMPAVQWHAERQTRILEKRMAKGPEEKGQNAVLKRELTRQADRQARKLKKRRARAAAEKRKTAKAKQGIAVMKRKRSERVHAKKAAKCQALLDEGRRQAQLDKIPQNFDAGDLGQGHPTAMLYRHQRARTACMDRLHLRAPPLPPDLEVEWRRLRDWYCDDVARKYKSGTGAHFIKRVEEVCTKLGSHLLYSSADKVGGDATQFTRFVRSIRKCMPKAATSIRL